VAAISSPLRRISWRPVSIDSGPSVTSDGWTGSQSVRISRGRRSRAWHRAAISSGVTGTDTASSAPDRSTSTRVRSRPAESMQSR
jgi:hypothetical protein